MTSSRDGDLLSRAVELLDDGSSERGAALPWLGVALYSLGEFAESDRVLTEAVDSASGEDAAIAFFLACHGRGHNPVEGETIVGLEQAVRARLAELGDASPLAYAEGYHALARLLFWQGRTTDQLESARLARDYARQAGVTVLEGMSAIMAATALMYGESSWDEYEAFAHALLAERDRLGGIVDNVLPGLAVAAAFRDAPRTRCDCSPSTTAALLERGDEYNARTQGQNRGYALYLAGDLGGGGAGLP